MMDHVVDQIEEVRRNNNKLWMDLLRLALSASPDKAKDILGKIRKNDMKVSELVGMIAHDGN